MVLSKCKTVATGILKMTGHAGGRVSMTELAVSRAWSRRSVDRLLLASSAHTGYEYIELLGVYKGVMNSSLCVDVEIIIIIAI